MTPLVRQGLVEHDVRVQQAEHFGLVPAPQRTEQLDVLGQRAVRQRGCWSASEDRQN